MSHVWYVSYGSNLSASRLACYIEGGRPPGGSRTNPGCRDRTPPLRTVPVDLPGRLYFTGESPQWGGGAAFYDHETPGPTAARGYLVTVGQLADIAAQEMYREPSPDDPLEKALLTGLAGGRHAIGTGRYETLVEVGRLDDLPMYTFTSGHRASEVPHTGPAPAYLAVLAAGLRESRDWDDDQISAYLGHGRRPSGVEG